VRKFTMTVFNGSAKDYAASLGLCAAGRGRPNAAAIEAIAKARAEGMTFSKESVKPVKQDRPKVTESNQTDKPTVVIKGKDIRPAAAPTSEPGTKWTGFFHDKAVTVSGATCCTNCKVSLAYHTCNAPTAVVGDGTIIPVAIRT
jgi:hypothetical protein